MTADLAAFVAVAAVVIATPGQDTALTIRNTLAGGRRGGVATALGVASGQVVWAVSASVGLAGLLLAFAPAFLALKVVGGTYLVYLGASALWRAARGRPSSAPDGHAFRAPRAAYRQGVLSNLGNPKMALFFCSLLPQFVHAGAAAFLSLLALGVVFAAMTLGWLVAYALVTARAARVIRRSRVQRVLDAVSGIVLIGLGLRLATERR